MLYSRQAKRDDFCEVLFLGNARRKSNRVVVDKVVPANSQAVCTHAYPQIMCTSHR